MVQIEPFPCNSRKELETRERYWVEQLKSKLNCKIPTQTIKEYRENNKEIILQKNKEYRENNKDKISEKDKEYYNNIKEKKAEQQKEWYKNIEEKMAEKMTCNCGCQANNSSLLNHQKSAKHLKLMLEK